MSTTFQKKLYGDDVTEIDNKLATFSLSEKRELKIDVIDTDGDVSIPFTDIDDIKVIYIQSESNDNVFNLKLNDGTNDFILSGVSFSLEPNSTFATDISSISISTDSTTAISVSIIILGGEFASS